MAKEHSAEEAEEVREAAGGQGGEAEAAGGGALEEEEAFEEAVGLARAGHEAGSLSGLPRCVAAACAAVSDGPAPPDRSRHPAVAGEGGPSARRGSQQGRAVLPPEEDGAQRPLPEAGDGLRDLGKGADCVWSSSRDDVEQATETVSPAALVDGLVDRILHTLLLDAVASPAVGSAAAAGALPPCPAPLAEEELEPNGVANILLTLVTPGLVTEPAAHGEAVQVPLSTFIESEEALEAGGRGHETSQIWHKLVLDALNEALRHAAAGAGAAGRTPLRTWTKLPPTPDRLRAHVEDACGRVLELVERNARGMPQVLFGQQLARNTLAIEEVCAQLPRFVGDVIGEVADRILVQLIEELA